MSDPDSDDPMQPESWHGVPNVCGSCIAWRPEAPQSGDELAIGSCKLRPELGRVPADLKKCDRYMARGQFTYQPGTDPGRKRRRSKTLSVLKRDAEGRTVRTDRAAPQPRPPAPKEIDLGEDAAVGPVRAALLELHREELGLPRRALHPRFEGGRLEVLDSGGQRTREIPMEQFFERLDHLATTLDRLEEALERGRAPVPIADLMARMRGSLTTFNLLFADKSDYFSSK